LQYCRLRHDFNGKNELCLVLDVDVKELGTFPAIHKFPEIALFAFDFNDTAKHCEMAPSSGLQRRSETLFSHFLTMLVLTYRSIRVYAELSTHKLKLADVYRHWTETDPFILAPGEAPSPRSGTLRSFANHVQYIPVYRAR
jgi:hypothetical protein